MFGTANSHSAAQSLQPETTVAAPTPAEHPPVYTVEALPENFWSLSWSERRQLEKMRNNQIKALRDWSRAEEARIKVQKKANDKVQMAELKTKRKELKSVLSIAIPCDLTELGDLTLSQRAGETAQAKQEENAQSITTDPGRSQETGPEGCSDEGPHNQMDVATIWRRVRSPTTIQRFRMASSSWERRLADDEQDDDAGIARHES